MRLIGGCEIARFGPVVKQSSMLFAENTGCCTARAGRNRREQRAALDGRCKPGGSCYLTSATASQNRDQDACRGKRPSYMSFDAAGGRRRQFNGDRTGEVQQGMTPCLAASIRVLRQARPICRKERKEHG